MNGALASALVSVRTDVPAISWRDAVEECGADLAAAGVTTPDYTAEMIEAIERLGPYIVVAPGIALAHARPSPAVRRTGLSWVALREPVAFGHRKNDPVRLVIGLAAVDHDRHLEAMAGLAGLLADAEGRERLLTAAGPDEVRRLISGADDAPPVPTTPTEERELP